MKSHHLLIITKYSRNFNPLNSNKYSFSIHFILFPLANILSPIGPHIFSSPLSLSFRPISFINITIQKFINSSTTFFCFHSFTNILLSIFKQQSSQTIPLLIAPLAFIAIPIRIIINSCFSNNCLFNKIQKIIII